MAGKPFQLSIVSDVRDVLRSNADVEQSFEQVADALDDLAREGQDAGRDLERSLDGTADSLEDTGDAARDAGRDIERHLGDAGDEAARDLDRSAEKITDSLEDTGDAARDAGRDIERHLEDASDEGEDAAKNLERSFKEAFDQLKTDGRTSTREVAADTRRNMKDAEGATETFRDEARSNLSESVSSFRGEMEDIPDLMQDVLGGVVADLGPAGAVGAGFAAVGLGLAVKFYEDWKEQTERVEQRTADMYEDMLDSGRKYLSDQFLNTQISGILNSDEDAIMSYSRAQEIAAATGLDLVDVVRGYAGEAESAERVSRALNDAIAEAEDNFTGAAAEGNAFGQALDSDAPRLEGYRDELEQVNGQIATASERAEVYRGAQVQSAEAIREHVQALAEQTETLDEAAEAIAENNEQISDNTERGIANRGVLAGLVDDLLDLQRSAYEAGAGTEDLTLLQARQAEQFLETAEAAGYEEDAALDLAEQLGLIPTSVITDIREQGVDTVIRQADRARAAVDHAAEDRTVNLYLNDNNLQWQADQAARRIRPPVIPVYSRLYNEVA